MQKMQSYSKADELETNIKQSIEQLSQKDYTIDLEEVMEQAIKQTELENENGNLEYFYSLASDNNTANSKMVQAIRSSNFIAIQNLNSKYKSVTKEIIARLLRDLQDVILKQCNRFLSQVVDIKQQLFEANVKLKQQLVVITEQEIVAQEIKLKQSSMGDGGQLKKLRQKFENQIASLEQDKEKYNSELLKSQLDLEHFKQQYYSTKYNYNMLKQEHEKINQEFALQTNELREKLQASQLYSEKEKERYGQLEKKMVKVQNAISDFSGPNKKETDQLIIEQQEEILKLRRDLESIRKNKCYDSSQRHKLIQQYNEIQLLAAKNAQLEKNYKELLEQVNQPTPKVLNQLNQFLLHPPHLKTSKLNSVDHYYQSPKNSKQLSSPFTNIPKFDLNQIDYDDINTSHSNTINKLKVRNQINTFVVKKQEQILELERPRYNSLFQKNGGSSPQKKLGSPQKQSIKLSIPRSTTEDDRTDNDGNSGNRKIKSYKKQNKDLSIIKFYTNQDTFYK